jgi:hypothetical protein
MSIVGQFNISTRLFAVFDQKLVRPSRVEPEGVPNYGGVQVAPNRKFQVEVMKQLGRRLAKPSGLLLLQMVVLILINHLIE